MNFLVRTPKISLNDHPVNVKKRTPTIYSGQEHKERWGGREYGVNRA